MFDRARQHFGLGGSLFLPQERLDNQINHVPHGHIAKKPPQQPEGLHREMQQLVDKQVTQSRAAHVVDHVARKAGGIDFRALEILVPIVRLG